MSDFLMAMVLSPAAPAHLRQGAPCAVKSRVSWHAGGPGWSSRVRASACARGDPGRRSSRGGCRAWGRRRVAMARRSHAAGSPRKRQPHRRHPVKPDPARIAPRLPARHYTLFQISRLRAPPRPLRAPLRPFPSKSRQFGPSAAPLSRSSPLPARPPRLFTLKIHSFFVRRASSPQNPRPVRAPRLYLMKIPSLFVRRPPCG